MITLLYISQLAEPDLHDLSVYAGQADGEDDVAWFRTRLSELGLNDAIALTPVRVCLGDALPDPSDFDAVVIGGSYHMTAADPEHRPARCARLIEPAEHAPLPLTLLTDHVIAATDHDRIEVARIGQRIA